MILPSNCPSTSHNWHDFRFGLGSSGRKPTNSIVEIARRLVAGDYGGAAAMPGPSPITLDL